MTSLTWLINVSVQVSEDQLWKKSQRGMQMVNEQKALKGWKIKRFDHVHGRDVSVPFWTFLPLPADISDAII